MLDTLLFEHSALQAVIVIFIIIGLGLALGRLKIAGISLGVTFVFFMGILAGHLGLGIDPSMLSYAQNFGLIIFVYALGVQVGPGFFNSFRKGGLKLNLLGLAVVLLGTIMTALLSKTMGVPLPDMVGIMCGATTNTPALAAAQQTLEQLGMDTNAPALGCAVTYPLGVVGVIIAMVLIKKFSFNHKNISQEKEEDKSSTYIAGFKVQNPAIFGKTISAVAALAHDRFVISRIWREGTVSIPDSQTVLLQGDRLLVVTNTEEANELTLIFGEREEEDWNKKDIDWNKIDDKAAASHWIVVTKYSINGKSIGSLKLRNKYGVNISRVFRAGVMLLATPDLVLQMGDRLIAVGKDEAIRKMEAEVGNAVKDLKEPNLVSMSIGIILGLVLGAIPVYIPGISAPVKLGLAGGPIIVGIIMGAFGPRIHMVTYITESANLMIRRLGLSMYLACLGLDAGKHFFDTVMRPEGLLWIGAGFLITVLPVIIVGIWALKIHKLDLGTVYGMLCGSMANSMALTYASDNVPNDNAAVSYTVVYPLSMFLRVLIAQLLLVFLL